jgi:1,4-dihydroxy-6-naphthoate synthase
MRFARGLDPQQADEFVGMYVNEWTLDYGPEGRKAVSLLLQRGFDRGIIPHRINVEFVTD